MKKWNKKVSPERYAKQWPNGPEAELARSLTADAPLPIARGNEPAVSVRFFSPRSNGLSIIIEPKAWFTHETPAGSRTLQSEGKSAQFVNSIFITEDSEIIDFLTNTYKDRRFPVVREDTKTASVR